MFAQDLVAGVALDALCARVPAAHAAIGIKHVDGAIADALNQQAKLLFAAPQTIFGFLPLSEVARHRGVTNQRAIGGRHQIHYRVGPIPRAILATSPALGLYATFRPCEVKRTLWLAGIPVFFQVQAFEVAAGDFRFRIARISLRALVPACDIAVPIEQIDGVVDNRLD